MKREKSNGSLEYNLFFKILIFVVVIAKLSFATYYLSILLSTIIVSNNLLWPWQLLLNAWIIFAGFAAANFIGLVKIRRLLAQAGLAIIWILEAFAVASFPSEVSRLMPYFAGYVIGHSIFMGMMYTGIISLLLLITLTIIHDHNLYFSKKFVPFFYSKESQARLRDPNAWTGLKPFHRFRRSFAIRSRALIKSRFFLATILLIFLGVPMFWLTRTGTGPIYEITLYPKGIQDDEGNYLGQRLSNGSYVNCTGANDFEIAVWDPIYGHPFWNDSSWYYSNGSISPEAANFLSWLDPVNYTTVVGLGNDTSGLDKYNLMLNAWAPYGLRL
ncbi:MAG: hypothetical protein ACFFCS_26485, partial [Candidatus Hodarchaeota archaeon]